jgi:hypothetical protein
MSTIQRPTVELYVRADAPTPERRAAVVERLQTLTEADRIADYRVHGWPSGVSLDLAADADTRWIHDAFEAFEAWADRNGVGIRPPFDVHETHCVMTGASEERLRLPVACLAVFDGETLLCVYPHVGEDGVRTVDDALSALADGDLPTPRATADAPAVVRHATGGVAAAERTETGGEARIERSTETPDPR